MGRRCQRAGRNWYVAVNRSRVHFLTGTDAADPVCSFGAIRPERPRPPSLAAQRDPIVANSSYATYTWATIGVEIAVLRDIPL
jgi:hypothetical protein